LARLGGAAENYAFIEHFQEVARGHFTVRQLERLYGKDKIRTEYDQIAQQWPNPIRAQPVGTICLPLRGPLK